MVLEDTTESPLDFKQIKLVQDPMDCSTPDFPVFHYCELESMGSQRVGHDLVTEHTHNLDPEFKFLTLCQRAYQMFSLKLKELSIAFN